MNGKGGIAHDPSAVIKDCLSVAGKSTTERPACVELLECGAKRHPSNPDKTFINRSDIKQMLRSATKGWARLVSMHVRHRRPVLYLSTYSAQALTISASASQDPGWMVTVCSLRYWATASRYRLSQTLRMHAEQV